MQPRILAVDYGRVRLGLAVSDALGMASHPLPALRRSSPEADLAALRALIADREVARLVVGLPLNMDGSDGPSAQSARAFARNWVARSPLPVILQDERLSTSAVTRTLLEADASRRRREMIVDKMAAAYILQGALDRLRNLR